MSTVIRHIVMWNVRGDDATARARNLALLKAEFESLRGRIPGLLELEVGIDELPDRSGAVQNHEAFRQHPVKLVNKSIAA